jgi:hypothetical protein
MRGMEKLGTYQEWSSCMVIERLRRSMGDEMKRFGEG